MLSPVTTNFLGRLRDNDQAAWYELWETFGPVVQAQLAKWGRGRIGQETVRDLSQETLAALSESIERFDPKRGVRFSTWLLSIAKHVLGDEMDRRGALKRGGARPAASLEEGWMVASTEPAADAQYEAAVFRAKVEAAIRLVSKECDFTDFATFRMRVLEGQSGKDVAAALGTSEPTVSRRVARVRDALRARLRIVVATYSFTEDESREPDAAGLKLAPHAPVSPQSAATDASEPNAQADAAFDSAIGEIYSLQALAREELAKRQSQG
jgi:RNA polymerase sigma factor (sigma-70 family)